MQFQYNREVQKDIDIEEQNDLIYNYKNNIGQVQTQFQADFKTIYSLFLQFTKLNRIDLFDQCFENQKELLRIIKEKTQETDKKNFDNQIVNVENQIKVLENTINQIRD